MKITLLYQVSHYIRVKKQRNVKSWDQQNYLVIRGFCYIRPVYNEVPLYSTVYCSKYALARDNYTSDDLKALTGFLSLSIQDRANTGLISHWVMCHRVSFPLIPLLSSLAEDFDVLVNDLNLPHGDNGFAVRNGGDLDALDEGIGGEGFQLADHHHARIHCMNKKVHLKQKKKSSFINNL